MSETQTGSWSRILSRQAALLIHAFLIICTLPSSRWRPKRGEKVFYLALTRFTNPLSAPQRAALLRLTQQVRQEAMQLASDYCLDVAEDNLLSIIKAEFSLLWCDLEEVRPQKLRNYGTVDPQAVLGPPVQRLIKLMLAINDVASGKQDVIDMWQETNDNISEGRER